MAMQLDKVRELVKGYAQVVEWAYALPRFMWLRLASKGLRKRRLGIPTFAVVGMWLILGHVRRKLRLIISHLNTALLLTESADERNRILEEVNAVERFADSIPSRTFLGRGKVILAVLYTSLLLAILPLASDHVAALYGLVGEIRNAARLTPPDVGRSIPRPIEMVDTLFPVIAVAYLLPAICVLLPAFNLKRFSLNHGGAPLEDYGFDIIRRDWYAREGVYKIETAVLDRPGEPQLDLMALMALGAVMLIVAAVDLYVLVAFNNPTDVPLPLFLMEEVFLTGPGLFLYVLPSLRAWRRRCSN
ncbi:MAG: hypothetical protein FJ290_10160 [Planctomycetes bacterium]|nr:hypothetical protein [Planctomycetota bacterium]